MEDRTLELFYAGGYSAGSLAVYVPEEKVLFTGDNIVVVCLW
jgi:glyoxylase-like metal-dependent hydrolase (beta-lactamase superfamily II)